MKRRRLRGKALLVASAGLASVTCVGCPNKAPGPVGNLMAPPPDAQREEGAKRKAEEEARAAQAAAKAKAEAEAKTEADGEARPSPSAPCETT